MVVDKKAGDDKKMDKDTNKMISHNTATIK